jgi:hypothetical protein
MAHDRIKISFRLFTKGQPEGRFEGLFERRKEISGKEDTSAVGAGLTERERFSAERSFKARPYRFCFL